MTIQGFELSHETEEVKKAFGYTNKVHRMIEGEIKEIDNPQTIEQYLSEWAKGAIENKIKEKCSCDLT